MEVYNKIIEPINSEICMAAINNIILNCKSKSFYDCAENFQFSIIWVTSFKAILMVLLLIVTSMSNPFPFRASKSRPTKQQEQQRIINEQIINYITTLQEDKNAETLWLGMNDQGYNMSISSFHTRLKKMVEAGIIEKISLGYNKHSYRIAFKA